MSFRWAIDPGPTPGVARILPDLTGFETWQCDDVETLLYWLWDNANDGTVMDVAMEDFFLSGGGRPKTPSGSKTTIEVIGAVKFICEYHHIPLVMQAPGDAKEFSSSDKLKLMGWKTPSNPDHQRSAARHLLLRLARTGAINPLTLIP